MTKPVVEVVCGALRLGEHYLIAKRAVADNHGGLWEFPGGKLHKGETAQKALERELGEELSIAIPDGVALGTVQHDYGSWIIHLHVILVSLSSRPELVLHEHQAARWVSIEKMTKMELASADKKVVSLLPV